MRLSLLDNLDHLGNAYYPSVDQATVIEKEIWDELVRALSRSVTSVAADITLDDTHWVVNVNCDAAARVVTLPAVAPPAGTGSSPRQYRIKKTGTSLVNALTINRAGSDTFDDGSTSLVIAYPGHSVDLVGDNVSTWGRY